MRSYPAGGKPGNREKEFIHADTASFICSTSSRRTRDATSIFLKEQNRFPNLRFTNCLGHPDLNRLCSGYLDLADFASCPCRGNSQCDQNERIPMRPKSWSLIPGEHGTDGGDDHAYNASG